MYPQIACKRGSIVTLVAFVWLLSTVRLCWENNLAQNWNFSCYSAAILFPVRQIHEDNLQWQQKRLPRNMFSGKSSSCAEDTRVLHVHYNKDDLWKFSCISFSCTAIFKNKILQKIATKTTFGNRFVCFSTFSNVSWRRLHKRILTATQFVQQFLPKIETQAVLQRQFCFLCSKYMGTIYIDNRDDYRTMYSAAIPLPVRQNTSSNFCKELQQQRLLKTGL